MPPLYTNSPDAAQVPNSNSDCISQSDNDLSDLLGDGPSEFTITIFSDRFAKSISTENHTLASLAKRISGTSSAAKENLPLLKLATFGNVRTADGSLRSDNNVVSITGIEGDYDNGQISVDEAECRLCAAGVTALLHTSSRHTEAAPRWRVLCPLSAAMAPAEREALCARLNGALGGILGGESFTLSQTYYFGGIDGAVQDVRLINGRYLDRVTGIPPIGRKASKAKREPGAPSPEPLDLSESFIDEVMRHVPNIGTDWQGQFSRAAFALSRQYRGNDVGRQRFHDWACQCEHYSKKETDARYDSVTDDDRVDLVTFEHLIRDAEAAGCWSRWGADDFDELLPLSELPDDCTDPLYLNRAMAKVRVGGKSRIAIDHGPGKRVSFVIPEEFHKHHSHRKIRIEKDDVPLTRVWFAHPKVRKYDNVVFLPGQATPDSLNLWRGWGVQPSFSKSCALYLDHLRNIVCGRNEAHYQWLLGWMAHLIQRPQEKPGTAVILRGEKGAGKDTFGEYFGAIFPANHVPLSNQEHLTGKFNAHMAEALLLHLEEGFWAGDHAADGILKSLITRDAVMLERKGIDAVEMRSFARILVTSNADWVVPATPGERRYFVLDVSSERAKDTTYFGAIRAEMSDGGPAALLHYLQNFDLRAFDVRTPPETAALTAQKTAGLRGVAAWWYERLQEGDLGHTGFDDDAADWQDGAITVAKSTLYTTYEEWAKGQRFDGRPATEEQLGTRLRDYCKGVTIFRPRTDGRKRQYTIPPLDACREAFEKKIGGEIEWAR